MLNWNRRKKYLYVTQSFYKGDLHKEPLYSIKKNKMLRPNKVKSAFSFYFSVPKIYISDTVTRIRFISPQYKHLNILNALMWKRNQTPWYKMQECSTFPHNWRCGHAKDTGKFSIIIFVEDLYNHWDTKLNKLIT